MKRYTTKLSKLIDREKNIFTTIMFEAQAESIKTALDIARINGDELFGQNEYAIEVFEIIEYPNCLEKSVDKLIAGWKITEKG